MTDSSMEAMWSLMRGQDIEVVSDHRNLDCNFCDTLMLDAYISKCGCQFCKVCVDDVTKKGSLTCQAKHEDCMPWSFLPDHSANIKVSKLKVRCPNVECKDEIEMWKLVEHLRDCDVHLTDCPYEKIGCDKKEDKRESLASHLTVEVVTHSQLVIEVIEALKNEISLLKEEIQKRDIRADHEKEVLEQRLQEDFKRNSDLFESLKINLVKESPTQTTKAKKELLGNCQYLPIGEISWLFKNFYGIVQNAFHKSQRSVYSEPFLSHKDGYQLCLVMNPRGYASGKETHLYIGFIIMRGNFDDDLPWPFNGTITISIVNRVTNDRTFVRKYNYDSVDAKIKHLLDKPTAWGNHCWGDPQLVPLHVLYNSPALLMNDSLMVNCTVVPFQC